MAYAKTLRHFRAHRGATVASSTIKRVRLAVIVFYLVLFAGLALYDERPDPAMIDHMTRPLADINAPDNAYVVFLGFDGPEGKSPYDWGLGKLREVENAVASKTNIGEYLLSLDDKEKLAFKGERPAFYGSKDKGILHYVSSHSSDAEKLARENRELLRRYKSLHSYSSYDEPLDLGYYMPIPRFSPIRSVHALYLLELARTARAGDITRALEGLQKDIGLWRHISRDSDTLISQLVSIAMISTDIRFAAELGTLKTLKESEMALLRNVLRQFDKGEASMARAFRGEARWMYKSMDLILYRGAKSTERLFFKQNATDNRMYADIQRRVRLAELPPEDFAIQAKTEEIRKTGIPFLYNPAGEILSIIGQSHGSKYIEKGHNLEGLRRLAWLKVVAKQENIHPAGMQQFLDAQSTEFNDPYTGQAMKWDPEKDCIYFKQVTEDKPVEMFL